MSTDNHYGSIDYITGTVKSLGVRSHT